MLNGSCLCGAVRYEYDGEIEEVSLCHCSQCRKATGSAFIAVSPIDTDKFSIVQGADQLKEFRLSANKARVFCATCASPIYSARDDLPGKRRLRLGSLDTPFVCKNTYHIYSDDKCSWHDITDHYPQYPGAKADGLHPSRLA